MLVWELAQAAFLPVAGFADVVGRKPPWKKPQLTFFALSRSPMLGQLIATLVRAEQSSKVGSRSPMMVPPATTLLTEVGVAPWVCPATRLSAPGGVGRQR